MKIKPKMTFLHGRERYEAGKEYEVSEGLGTHFCLVGWADDLSGTLPSTDAPAAEHVLDVHDGGHDTASN